MSNFNRGIIESALKDQYVEVDMELRGKLNAFYDKHQDDDVTIELIKTIIHQVADAQYKLGAERQKLAIEDNFILTNKVFEYPLGKGTAEDKEKFVGDLW